MDEYVEEAGECTECGVSPVECFDHTFPVFMDNSTSVGYGWGHSLRCPKCHKCTNAHETSLGAYREWNEEVNVVS